MKIHKHWVTLMPAPVIALLIVSIATIYLKYHPTQLVGFLHINTNSALTPTVKIFYTWANWLAGALIIFAFVLELVAVITWCTQYIILDERFIEYCEWPSKSESIPLNAIADVQFEKQGPLSLLFGYGTLRIDAGRAEERLTFVPNVEQTARTIRQYGR